MKSGDVDGRCVVYDLNGRLILEKNENLLYAYLYARSCLTIPLFFPEPPSFYKVKRAPDGSIVKEKLPEKQYRKACEKRKRMLLKWEKYAIKYVRRAFKRIISRYFLSERIPGKLYVTNKRAVYLRQPYVSEMLADYTTSAYADELALMQQNAMEYHLCRTNKIEIASISDDMINFYYIEEGRPEELCVGFFSLNNLFQRRALINYLQKIYPNHWFTKRGGIRWHRLTKLFIYEDVEGLGKVYDTKGRPILEKGEKIIDQKETIPIVTIRDPYCARFPRVWYEVLNPRPGMLYKTNKRIIFIRKIYDDDIQYREFSDGTHISFYFSPKDATKHKITKEGEIYEIKVDKRNWLRILIPKYPEASLKVHEYKQKFLVPFGTDEWDEARAEMNWLERNEDNFVLLSRIPLFLGMMFGGVGTIYALIQDYYSYIEDFIIPLIIPITAILSSFFYSIPLIFKKIKEKLLFKEFFK